MRVDTRDSSQDRGSRKDSVGNQGSVRPQNNAVSKGDWH